MSNLDSNKSVEPTMFYMDSPTETKQMRKENASSSNEYSVSRGDGAGDTGDPPLCETTVLKEINVDTGSTTPPISRLPLQNRTSAIYRADLTTVKISALLYEITERTKQLAQPRPRVEVKAHRKPLKSNLQMSRIIELALPKMTHNVPPKPINFISPNALRANATERIIELSQPRRGTRYFELQNKTSSIQQSCNLRARGLPTSKLMDHLRCEKAQLRSLKDNVEQTKSSSSSRDSTSNIDMRSSRKKCKRRNDSRIMDEFMTRKRISLIRLSRQNSDRSVVIVNLNQKKHSRFSTDLARESRSHKLSKMRRAR